MAKIKIVKTNKLFLDYLDKDYSNINIIKTNNSLILKNSEIEIFINENHKLNLSEQGLLIEGYCLINENLGSLTILFTEI